MTRYNHAALASVVQQICTEEFNASVSGEHDTREDEGDPMMQCYCSQIRKALGADWAGLPHELLLIIGHTDVCEIRFGTAQLTFWKMSEQSGEATKEDMDEMALLEEEEFGQKCAEWILGVTGPQLRDLFANGRIERIVTNDATNVKSKDVQELLFAPTI